MMKPVFMVSVFGTWDYVKVSKEAFDKICNYWKEHINGFEISDDYYVFTDQDFGVYSEYRLLGYCYFVEE